MDNKQTIKPSKRKLNKVEISGIVIAAVILIVTVILIAFNSFINTKIQTASARTANSIGNTVFYMLMPKELDGEIDGVKYTFYVRKNPNYDKSDVEHPLEYFDYYYYDDEGNEVDLGSEGIFHGKEGGDGEQMISFAFYFKAAEKAQSIKKVVNVVVTVFVVLLVIGLIGVWFVLWSRKEDREKERIYGNKNNKKSKNKK